ncbi:hypothetical protein DER45DRAFT_619201 [Fusarium avenaceum]|nr:hypothetical protein DER45DRAFT_619201 [Fusarium avenaceum]
MDSRFHSSYKRFLRRAVNQAKEEKLSGLRCEICVTIAPPGTIIPCHSTKKSLMRHINKSHSTRLHTTESTINAWWSTISSEAQQEIFAAHDQMKREIRFYNRDFRGNVKHKAKLRAEIQRLDHRKLSYEFSGDQELPRPISVGHGLQRGSTPGAFAEFLASNPTAASLVTIGDIPTDDTLKDEILQTPHLASNITFHTLDELPPMRVSPNIAHLVQFGPIPGSPDYLPNAETMLDKWERESKKYESRRL